MNFGIHPPLSHGSIETPALIMPSDAATLKPLQVFGPSTVYVHSAIGSFVGYRSFQATRVMVGEMRYAQYECAILVRLIPRRKRKERSFVETSHASTVIVEGWIAEMLPAAHDANGTARFPGFDKRWDHEFANWLDALVQQSGRKILLDLRGHDPQARIFSPPPAPSHSPETSRAVDQIVVPSSARRHLEGAATEIVQTRYERDSAARAACLAHYGLACQVCGFDFEKQFGELGAGFIHVHHLEQLAIAAAEHAVDPIRDLRPVCPNCHAMLHRRRPPLTPEELRVAMLTKR